MECFIKIKSKTVKVSIVRTTSLHFHWGLVILTEMFVVSACSAYIFTMKGNEHQEEVYCEYYEGAEVQVRFSLYHLV